MKPKEQTAKEFDKKIMEVILEKETDAFFSGVESGMREGERIERKRCLEIIEKMLKRNDEIVAEGRILPKEVKIPFINGIELIQQIQGVGK